MENSDLPARRFRYTLEKMARAATSTVMYATGTMSEVAILVVCFSCSLMQLYKMYLERKQRKQGEMSKY